MNVDYSLRQWWTSSSHAARVGRFNPQQVVSDLRSGYLKVSGVQEVNGRQDLKLTGAPPDLFGGTLTILVSPTSYLPDSSISNEPAGVGVTQYQWLPASSTARPLLVVTAPGGFTHVTTPPTVTPGLG